ncbi:branched-chain amino acid ABC transporter permease [Ectothiorhodospiraceae bacterium WFHF3C12]|nr:branched-chain amino acid ABC transporter permease [Ectothiorhodospiraceae bacterium WFHF3C12]
MSTEYRPHSWPREGIVLGVFAVVVFAMPWWLTWIGGYEALATKIVIWAIFALGFDILLGFTGYLSFGHAAFFGTSGYVAGLMFLHYSESIIPALLACLVVSIVLALVLGFLTLRRTGIYFAILTLAFAQMLHAAALSIFQEWTGGDNGLTMSAQPNLFGLPMDGLNVFYLAAVLVVIGFAMARQIRRSPLGLMLRSIKENQMRLEYTGVNVMAYKMTAYLISAIYAGTAGWLMVVYEPYVATKFLHWSTSGEVVIMSVIGGVNTLIGPMIGAAFMMYFENVVQSEIGELWKLVLGAIFVLIVIFLPGGFVDGYNRVRKVLGQKVPSRRHNVPDSPESMRKLRERGRTAEAGRTD